MILPMIVTGIWGIFVAGLLGRREKKRLGALALQQAGMPASDTPMVTASDPTTARPRLLWFNFALTVA